MTRPVLTTLALVAAFVAGVLAAPQQRVIVAEIPAPLIKEILP